MAAASPVLALSALELAVKSAGAGSARHRGGGGAALAVQAQVKGRPNGALLQADSLRAALVAQVGRH